MALPNNAVAQPAGSPSLAAAAHGGRWKVCHVQNCDRDCRSDLSRVVRNYISGVFCCTF
jgi:hypothetical protein